MANLTLKRIKDWAKSITSFRTGDVIPVDGPDGTAKMSKDDLLKETAENALGSIHLLSDTTTEADIKAGNYFALDGVEGTKRLPAESVAKARELGYSKTEDVTLDSYNYSIIRHTGKPGDKITLDFNADKPVNLVVQDIGHPFQVLMEKKTSGTYVYTLIGSSVSFGLYVFNAGTHATLSLYSGVIGVEFNDSKRIEAAEESIENLDNEVGSNTTETETAPTFVNGSLNVNNGQILVNEQGNRGVDTNYHEIPEGENDYLELTSSGNGVVFYYETKNVYTSFVGRSDYWIPFNKYKITKNDFVGAKYVRFGMENTSVTASLKLVNASTGIKKDIEELKNSSPNFLGKDLLVLDVNGNGNFTTLEDALNAAQDTKDKRVTILVMPGIYEMVPKVDGIGTYVEGKRNVEIVGLDKNATTLVSKCGFYGHINGKLYDSSVIRISGNVTIRNLTIKALSTEYNQYKSEWGWSSNDRQRSYCVHNDFSRREGEITEIVDCNLISDHFSCVGFGLQKNSKIIIKNCYCETTFGSESGNPNDYGTLYGHFHASEDGANQDFEVEDCQIVNTNSNNSISLLAIPDRVSSGTYKMLRNVVYTRNTQGSLHVANTKTGIFSKSSLSFGNNVNSMNNLE